MALVSNSTPSPTVMSLIIDGMDQGKCLLPYAGSQDSFGNKAMHQHITGVKQHGVGLTLYRTTETVPKGANLTIYCILRELHKFYDEHHYFPETLYVQVDGGAENANKYVLGMLELLVVKRICKDVWYTRLPTGHTHEDIDAVFGTIWSAFRAEPMLTMDEWKEKLLSVFEETTLATTLEDVWVVSDYAALLENCIIRGLGQLHKDLKTQHQWRFRAVMQCDEFKHGCKTTYRAYSSDSVIEFIRKPRQNCISDIGQRTGLEPTRVFCRWYPSPLCDVNRQGIEGMYLLETLPSMEVRPGVVSPTPAPLPDTAIPRITECLSEIRSKYHIIAHNAVRRWWSNWEVIYKPRSDNMLEYVAQLRRNRITYRAPLKDILFSIATRLEPRSLNLSINDYSDYDPNFRWPEVFARATNSVQSVLFNPNPPPPREYATNDLVLQDDLSRWNGNTVSYYTIALQRRTLEQLKALLSRRVGLSGEALPTTGKILSIELQTLL